MDSLQDKVNRAIIYSAPGSTATEIVELPIQEPKYGEVLLRMLYSGVCHSDYAIATNAWNFLGTSVPKGQIGGHEGVGVVVAHGPGVTSPAIGSKVGVKWATDACLNCDRCLAGGETSCLSATLSGFFTPGTFQQYCVSAAKYVTPIPDGIDYAGAAPLMCGGITVYAALKKANIKNGDWVVVSGAGGGLGHLAIQYAKALGGRVVALDIGSKAKLCSDLQADAFVDFTEYSDDAQLTAKIQEVTGGGAQIVLLCSSSNRAYAQGVTFLRFRGTMVCLGVPEGESVPIGTATVDTLVNSELTITAVKSGNRQEAKECVEIAARGLVKTHYSLRKMEDLTDIFNEMEAGQINGRIVIDLQ